MVIPDALQHVVMRRRSGSASRMKHNTSGGDV